MIESIILGLLQGLAEFLPISSSGHLVIGHELLGMNEAGMFFDIMLHARASRRRSSASASRTCSKACSKIRVPCA